PPGPRARLAFLRSRSGPPRSGDGRAKGEGWQHHAAALTANVAPQTYMQPWRFAQATDPARVTFRHGTGGTIDHRRRRGADEGNEGPADASAGPSSTSLRQLPDDREHRQEHAGHDEADDDAEEDDQGGLEGRGEALDGLVDLALVEVRDLLQHRVDGARLLADRDHRGDHRREHARVLLQRGADLLAALHRLLRLGEDVLDDRVAGGAVGDVDRLDDVHARAQQQAVRVLAVGDRRLLHQGAYDRRAQQEAVDDAGAVGGAPDEDQPHDRGDDDRRQQPPLEAQEVGDG